MKALTPMMLALLVEAATNNCARISPTSHEKHRRGLAQRGLIDNRGFLTAEALEYLHRPPARGGKREGAGRKPRPIPLDVITVKVEPEVGAKFRMICEAKGKSQAAQFSEWVKRERF